MSKSFTIPADFQAPLELNTTRIRLRPLTIHDLDADYDAVMSSIDHLRSTMPFGPCHDWPTPELSRDQNLIDLGWHQKEFQNRTSFAYTVVSPHDGTCLGCVYIYPSMKQEFDAQVIMWVRASEVASNLDEHLYDAVGKWIDDLWPFNSPGYPGRKLNWADWDALPEG
ncbi:MAG: hypothetical protein P8M22_10165 [Phycisphaerales bacterium]|nr:hypothetical protein [Phycisphaerales bacterium]